MVHSGDSRACNAFRWSLMSHSTEIGPDSAFFCRALFTVLFAVAWEWGKCSENRIAELG